jgi:hypothetical protein
MRDQVAESNARRGDPRPDGSEWREFARAKRSETRCRGEVRKQDPRSQLLIAVEQRNSADVAGFAPADRWRLLRTT